MKLRNKIKKEAIITIRTRPEDISIEGNASAIDSETDAKIAADIREQLENGNEWAWCAVEVLATWEGLEASDHIGACSYSSEADFKTGGYYDDMVNSCIDQLEQMANRVSRAVR